MSKNTLEPPSYETVVRDDICNDRTRTAPTQAYTHAALNGLNNQLITSRAQHINTTISNHILPLIHYHMSIGLSRTTIALLPAQLPTTPDYEKSSNKQPNILEIVSSHTESDDDDLQQIYLPSELGSTAFWNQKSVLREFKACLEERLASIWSNIAKPALDEKGDISTEIETPRKPMLDDTGLQTDISIKPTPKPRSIFSWKPSSSRPSHSLRGTDGRSTSTPNTVKASTSLETNTVSNRIDVEVVPDEVCFRTQSSLGIYDTEKRAAVIIKVRVIGKFGADCI